MKKILILGSFLGLLLGTTACREEFLETEPTQTLANPPAQAKLYGLYNMMVNTYTGGTTAHEDFGQKGYDIMSDFLSNDLALNRDTYGRYRTLANLTATKDFTNNFNYMPWRYYYRIVFATNEIIEGIGGNDAVPTSESDKFSMGQAKAMRAYAYFYLSQFYNAKYDPAADSIPLYTQTTLGEAKGKAKQSEVYGQIIKDLKDAIILLDGFARPNKGVVNQNVAKGLLAYTYAATGDYVQSAQISKEIMSAYPKTKTDELVYNTTTASGGGFNDLKTSSWMWGFDLTLENDLDLVSWWGQMDYYTYSYQGAGDYKVIDNVLRSKIKSDDIRKGQFNSVGMPTGKFYAPGRVALGQRSVVTDYLYMRSDEFYMLAAESLAKSGNEAEAKTILKSFLDNRLTNTSYIDALSGQSLLDEIYLQTKIEFFAEGKSYLAMKRNKATVTRGTNHVYLPGSSFSYDSDELTFDIPQGEINNNPNLK